MMWLTWRQFRVQALVALGGLGLVALYLVILGLAIRHSYDATQAVCRAGGFCPLDQFRRQYEAQLVLIGGLLVIVPAVIGTFWGAPLISRELESGTHRLVWNQSVTRARWLAVKLAVIALTALAVTGLFSMLLTWAASPVDRVAGARFSPLAFASRNIVPPGYAVFAFVLGATIGLLVRRTLPAMALTLAVFAAVQIVTPLAVRSHLITPVTATLPVSAIAEGNGGLQYSGDKAEIAQYVIAGAWVLTARSTLVNPDGRPATTAQFQSCQSGDLRKDVACLGLQKLSFTVSYQPGSRYWPFQWVELSVFLAATALLVGVSFRRIRSDFT